jgi:two-component system, sensor histidine kinase and response regulator
LARDLRFCDRHDFAHEETPTTQPLFRGPVAGCAGLSRPHGDLLRAGMQTGLESPCAAKPGVPYPSAGREERSSTFSLLVNHSPTEHGGIVLIVDDVPRNRDLLASILAPRQFEVIVAENGQVALAHVAARRPDLILLDLMMPGMDGMEVCRRLKDDPKSADVPVVFLTSANEAKLAADAIGMGAVDYITRPFNTAELLARVRTHVALKRTRDELQRIIVQKNELMSAVAHDLKNPISAVRFSALMLRDQGMVPPDPRAELVEDIVESCDGVLAFIQDRLEQSAKAAHLEHLRIGVVDLIDILNVVLTQNLPAAAIKNIELAVDFPETGAIQVQADPEALGRALNNLVSNAVKFSPRGSRVLVVVRRDDPPDRVRTEVRDQGPGITEEDRPFLFTPFRRLSAQPTGGESSTGLGLSIARELVEKMGGRIGCDSVPSGGASFWISLPGA